MALVPSVRQPVTIRMWSYLFGGSLLVGYGLNRRDAIGMPAVLVGGVLLWRAWDDLVLRRNAVESVRSGPRDMVEESSMGSFPASDPPAY